MSHSDSTAAFQAQNGRALVNGAARTVDWMGYPVLFQRVSPPPAPQPAEPKPAAPKVGDLHVRNIYEAFLGFCQASLFSPGTSGRFGRPSEAFAASKAIAAAEAFGFTREELQRLGCGLYSSPATVRDDLRGVGFNDADIDSSRIACDDAGRPRAEFSECLVVPLTDEAGQLRDFLLLTVGESGRAFCGYRFLTGISRSNIVAYGLQTALAQPTGRESLVLVDDVLECLWLQCRGVPCVAAMGTSGHDFSPRRWEELARLGVATVTLAFRNDENRAADVRDVLVNALRARTAPQVFVVEAYPAGERSAADVLRRFGRETCLVALATRSLAFHHKDFGALDRLRSTISEALPHRPAVPPAEPPSKIAAKPLPHHREAFRRHVEELSAALPVEDRRVADQVITVFAAAIESGDCARAAWTIDGHAANNPYFWMSNPQLRPGWSVPAPAGHLSSSVSSAAAVLDRMMKTPEAGDISPEMRDFVGRDAPSAVDWIISPSPRHRLASLCERLADALERQPLVQFVVACCDHTDRQVLLALATHLASRFSHGPGLSIEEVRRRLCGNEPAGGFRDKPWIADEAADRLRLWSSRLTFANCAQNPSGMAAVEQALETSAAKSAVGGLFFDGVPFVGWQTPYRSGDSEWLQRLAGRFGGSMTVAAAALPVDAVASHWGSQSPICWPLTQSPGGMAVLAALHDWLARETVSVG